MSIEIEIHAVEPTQVLALRQSVLRPDRAIEQSIFDGDDEPETLHIGAFSQERIVGVASLFRRAFPSEQGAAWQLRGMAVVSEARGQGIGRAMLEACVQHVARSGAMLWCNARTEAAGFYSKAGFEICGEEFEIPDVGPHFVMARRVEAVSST